MARLHDCYFCDFRAGPWRTDRRQTDFRAQPHELSANGFPDPLGSDLRRRAVPLSESSHLAGNLARRAGRHQRRVWGLSRAAAPGKISENPRHGHRSRRGWISHRRRIIPRLSILTSQDEKSPLGEGSRARGSNALSAKRRFLGAWPQTPDVNYLSWYSRRVRQQPAFVVPIPWSN